MTVPLRSVVMDVDLSALQHNLAVVRGLAGHREVIASVKANAYGFGVVEIGRALAQAGIRKLWTGNIDEAILLHEAAVDSDILLFGNFEPHQADAILHYDFQPTICDDASATRLEKVASAAGKRVPVWIKVDAGLGRFGVSIDEAAALIERVGGRPALELKGIYTHLPFSSIAGAKWASEQQAVFSKMMADPKIRQISAHATIQVWGSAGLLGGLPDASNAVCIGHGLFGLSPLEPRIGVHPPLRTLIHSLSAPVLQIAHRKADISQISGYGQSSGSHSATLGIGTADGLMKARNGKAQVILGNECRPVRAFTLENLIVDAEGVATGNFVRAQIIGVEGSHCITLEDWASWTGLSPLELMQSFSGRIPLRYNDFSIIHDCNEV